MTVSREKLQAEAMATGYRPEVLEKVIHLLNLLEGLRSHPFLRARLALKGGTALNLFVFDLPRLSVDIDLNYIGSTERETMLAERHKVEQAFHAVFAREGFAVTRQPDDHAGGKWRLRYSSAAAEGGNLEVDLNFLLRVPLWPITHSDSRPVGSYSAKAIPVLDVHELAGGKLAALLSRRASRDLFDAHQLLTTQALDSVKLRLAFVLYGGMNRKDWRTVTPQDVEFDHGELENQLTPVLSAAALATLNASGDWASRFISEIRAALAAVLPFSGAEREFLDRLLDHGEVRPDLLTADRDLTVKIASHPALLWKALNVRQHKSDLSKP
jgi:hypothetical protein